MTNVPHITFTATGLVVPQESDILTGVLQDYDAAFGGGLNQALETPQGQLASSTAAVVADANAVFAEFVNQVNPDTASGFMQDAIARIYFLDRIPGAPTIVTCLCTGAFGTTIPVGAQAQDTSGNIYVSLQEVVIPISGNVTVTFANVENGPIPCPENTLTTVYRAIPGWDTINNPSDGVLGQDVETQAAFAYRRAQSVALNARGSLDSIYANVFEVAGVLDVYVTENFTNDPVQVGSTNYELSPHSLLVSVIGGTDPDIAAAIWQKKDVGCDMNGNTTVVVTDTSGYDQPYPTYNVTFLRPDPLPILFEVELAASPNLPTDIVQQVKNSIIATFTGSNDGGSRVRIGSLLLASKFYPGVIAIGPEVSVLSILLGDMTPDQTSLLIGVDQSPTISEDDISVVLT